MPRTGEYPSGPRRIIIWNNGNEPWYIEDESGRTVSSGITIFSPELITHEFGHVISNEWAAREAAESSDSRQLSQRFFTSYYNGNYARQLDAIRVDTSGTFAYLWEPFESGSPNTNPDGTRNRSTGRIYNTRYTVEEFGAEAYAVWIYDKYASSSQQPVGQSVTIDDLVAAQKGFWEAVFSGAIKPGNPITPFDQQ
jgi:hypothetical protein